ncbi:MAG: T9SS type A sorting domain-containing protein, partial [Bacteroidetes bacterium]|nr:T9SS type A sorting domain-containing protein [Bacteroidota bacterium]
TTAKNIWQIGTPHKQFFNQSYSVPNAMVTDTSNVYPTNNYSSFDLYIGSFNSNFSSFYDLFIDFRQKFDSDTLRDGGYISISWDLGQSWMNILDDTLSLQYFYISPASNFGWWGNTNLYSASNTLFNGEKGFSGKSNGWVHSCMAWYDLPVKHPAGMAQDTTMILRFNFISDNIHNNREGWMIDDIRIFSIDLGSGINEKTTQVMQVHVTPNPFKTNAMVFLDQNYTNVEYQLMDMSGRILSEGKPGKCNEFEIRPDHFSAGLYMLKVSNGTGLSTFRRIILM